METAGFTKGIFTLVMESSPTIQKILGSLASRSVGNVAVGALVVDGSRWLHTRCVISSSTVIHLLIQNSLIVVIVELVPTPIMLGRYRVM